MNDAQQQMEAWFGDERSCLPGGHPDEWENHKIDVALASLAGFRMDKDGFCGSG